MVIDHRGIQSREFLDKPITVTSLKQAVRQEVNALQTVGLHKGEDVTPVFHIRNQ
jgi:hypothetical protein